MTVYAMIAFKNGIPNLVRCIKDFKAEEAIPFDDDFEARKVVFEKKTKKK